MEQFFCCAAQDPRAVLSFIQKDVKNAKKFRTQVYRERSGGLTGHRSRCRGGARQKDFSKPQWSH